MIVENLLVSRIDCTALHFDGKLSRSFNLNDDDGASLPLELPNGLLNLLPLFQWLAPTLEFEEEKVGLLSRHVLSHFSAA